MVEKDKLVNISIGDYMNYFARNLDLISLNAF